MLINHDHCMHRNIGIYTLCYFIVYFQEYMLMQLTHNCSYSQASPPVTLIVSTSWLQCFCSCCWICKCFRTYISWRNDISTLALYMKWYQTYSLYWQEKLWHSFHFRFSHNQPSLSPMWSIGYLCWSRLLILMVIGFLYTSHKWCQYVPKWSVHCNVNTCQSSTCKSHIWSVHAIMGVLVYDLDWQVIWRISHAICLEVRLLVFRQILAALLVALHNRRYIGVLNH